MNLSRAAVSREPEAEGRMKLPLSERGQGKRSNGGAAGAGSVCRPYNAAPGFHFLSLSTPSSTDVVLFSHSSLNDKHQTATL